MNVVKPGQWARSRWSLYPQPFLWFVEDPLGRLLMRVAGLILVYFCCVTLYVIVRRFLHDFFR